MASAVLQGRWPTKRSAPYSEQMLGAISLASDAEVRGELQAGASLPQRRCLQRPLPLCRLCGTYIAGAVVILGVGLVFFSMFLEYAELGLSNP